MVKLFRHCTSIWSVIIAGKVLQTEPFTSSSPFPFPFPTHPQDLSFVPNLHDKDVVSCSTPTSQYQLPLPLSMSKPDLVSWTQCSLGALYEAREDEAFSRAFRTVFSSSCEVRTNHAPSSLDAFRESVSSRRVASAGVTLSWENVITAGEGDSADEPSVVAGTLIITRSMKFRIRAAPAQRQTFINFSARVEKDPIVQANECDDRRRITSLYYTQVDKTPPIHFATPRPVDQEKEE